MRIEELISWETRNSLREIFIKEVKDELQEYVDIRLLNEEDRIELFFKKEYIKNSLTTRIHGVLSLLEIRGFDELIKVAKDKIAITNTIEQLDREVVEKIRTKGLESIIENFKL